MKRYIAIGLIAALTIVFAAGCGNNGLSDYKNAADRTAGIIRGQSSGEFTVSMDFNTEGMPTEHIEKLNYFKEISGSFLSTFDQSNDQSFCRNYVNMGGLGFDFDLYNNGEMQFVKLPVVGKYLELENLQHLVKNGAGKDESKNAESKNGDEESKLKFLHSDTSRQLSKAWIDTLEEKNVFQGKDIVLTTPDGEVKTKEYTITLNQEQLKEFGTKAMDILSRDETLRTNMNSIVHITGKQEQDSSDEFFENLRKQLIESKDINFKYTAYVDIDGYIVNEIITFETVRDAQQMGELEALHFRLELKNWDINKKQTFDFPILTNDNTLNTEELTDSMPSLFRGLFPEML